MREGYVAGRHVIASKPTPRPHCRQPGSRSTTRCCAPELVEPTFDGGGRVALIAARLGTTRLIDNLEF